MEKKDNPGVFIPPPLVYILIFFLSIFIQKLLPIDSAFFSSFASHLIGIFFIVIGLFFIFPPLLQFKKTNNTLITVKPANSLQTTGIYSISRNPMYLSLLLIYTGLAFLLGNWWTIVFILPIIAIITYFIIRPEEKYLERAFGITYLDYKKKVRRWL